MKRLLKFSLVLAFLFCLTLLSTQPCCMSTKDIKIQQQAMFASELMSHAVEFQITTNAGEQHVLGSGTYVDYDGPAVITAEHVWSAAVDSTVDDELGIVSCISVCHGDDCMCVDDEAKVDMDVVEDWALIKLTRPLEDATYASWDNELAKVGEEVWSVGSPYGIQRIVHGTVSTYITFSYMPFRSIAIDGYVGNGLSGGGVYNQKGELVAIVTRFGPKVTYTSYGAFPTNDDHLLIATPVIEVDPFMELSFSP